MDSNEDRGTVPVELRVTQDITPDCLEKCQRAIRTGIARKALVTVEAYQDNLSPMSVIGLPGFETTAEVCVTARCSGATSRFMGLGRVCNLEVTATLTVDSINIARNTGPGPEIDA